jgi:[ribosomal protein S18]-alanine N-acetyltransferase
MTSKSLKLQTLKLADLPQISAICAAYPELNWNEAKLKETLVRSDVFALGLWQEQRLISLVLFTLVLQEAELLLIATLPEACGSGHAFELLQRAITQLPKQNIKQIFLEVRTGNKAALKLYERLGFKTINVRKHYYANAHGPKEDAFLMELSLADN